MQAGLFRPLDRVDRVIGGVLAAALGLVGLGLAIMVLTAGTQWNRVLVALLCAVAGVYALVVAIRLFRNRTPREDQRLIPPWLMTGIGSLILVMAVVSLVLEPVDWLQTIIGLGFGIAAIYYGLTKRGSTTHSDQSGA
jgi:uncharacterized membrane protein